MRASLRVAWFAQVGILLMAWPVGAQLRTGELTSTLDGTIAPGYTADYGNMTGSDHSWTIGGIANYSGTFHNPNFLSFAASVYLNQSRANSNFQSISNASGVNASANVFGGSRFPGAITYSKAYNSEGNYSVPGLADYVTHGNNDAFAINWSLLLPDFPTLSAGFQIGSGKYSVYGTNDQGQTAFHSLNLHSNYHVDGLNMGAFYSLGGGHSEAPQVISGLPNSETHSSTSAYGFNATHVLPLQGAISGSVTRSTWTSGYLNAASTGSIDMFNVNASMRPAQKLTLTASLNFSDNLSGQLLQSVVAAGGVVTPTNMNQTSNSLDMEAVATYLAAKNLQTSAYIERRSQDFLGEGYGETTYGGSGSYTRRLFDGNLNSSVNATGNMSDQTDGNTLGFSTNENYNKRVLGWDVNGSFNYSQNVQTLLITYMSSQFSYSGDLRRHWGKFNVGAGAGSGRTALTDQSGTSSSSESFSASMGYGQWLTGNASYSKSSGQALVTGAGLVSVPVPSPALPSDLVSLYGGSGVSFGLSSSPLRGLLLTSSYSKSSSDTTNSTTTSDNRTDEFNSLIQYQFRKLNFTSGFSRLGQGFSSTGTTPEVISSFYIGVSRWFNFF